MKTKFDRFCAMGIGAACAIMLMLSLMMTFGPPV